MSVAKPPIRPAAIAAGRVALWLAFLVLIAAAIGLAWIGAGSLRPEVTAERPPVPDHQGGHRAEPISRADAALLDYVLTADDGTRLRQQREPRRSAAVHHGPGLPRLRRGDDPDAGRRQYRFTMPQKLAFVRRPPPPGSPKDSALTFDVRVRKVVPRRRGDDAAADDAAAAAATAGQRAPQ